MDAERRRRAGRIAGGVVYWAAVLVVSLALVAALIAWLNARDGASLRGDAHGAAACLSAANTTMRCEAL